MDMLPESYQGMCFLVQFKKSLNKTISSIQMFVDIVNVDINDVTIIMVEPV